jgi:ribose transport system permease protein
MNDAAATTATPAPAPPAHEPEGPGSPVVVRGGLPRWATILQKWGVLIAFAGVIVFFSLARPESFPTWDNVRTILNVSAALAVMAAVLTIPMIMGDFDLSISNHVQLLGAVAVTLMAYRGLSAGVSVVVVLLMGAVIGGVLGAVIAYTNVSAFVLTLGAGILMLGVELQITHSQTVSSGLDPAYMDIANTRVLSLQLPIWIALAVTVVLWFVTRHTVFGRYLHAVGNSPEAARLAGVNVELVRTMGFVIVGLGAAIAGVIITSQAASTFPSAATGQLLPAYAAVFLGAAMWRPGQFHVWGTLLGVVFMGTISSGLVQMNYQASTTNIVTGAVFMAAVLVSRLGSRRRA